MSQQKRPQFRFFFVMCNELEAMRKFYITTLGMPEVVFKEDHYFVVEQEGIEQVIFFQTNESVPALEGWAMQPGWKGGTVEVNSWSILIPEDDFEETVRKLKDAGYERFHDDPQWAQDSYWSFPVRDPMGNTTEIYTIPSKQ